MLSSPPPRFAACTSAFTALSRSSRFACTSSRISLVLDHVGEAVGADEEDVAVLGLDRERVDVDVGIGADRPRDHAPLRVDLRLLLRELAGLQQLVHERVIVGELLHQLAADEVRARVADVADRDGHPLDERDRHRRSHARGGGIGRGAVVDAAVRLLDERVDRFVPLEPVGVADLERRGGELRRDLAGLRAAHPVGDGEERRRDDVVVLVAAPPAPGVARDRVCPDRHLSPPPRGGRSRRRGGRRPSPAARRLRCASR